MRNDGDNYLQVLNRGFRAAGQVDDQGAAPDPGDCPRKHGMRGHLKAGLAHRFCQARRGPFNHFLRRFRGYVARGIRFHRSSG